MADDTSTADATTDDANTDDKSGDDSKTFNQQQVNDLIAREKGKIQSRYGDYDDLKQAAQKLAEMEAENQTEAQRLSGERDKFKGEAESKSAENLRLRVALAKSVPADLIDRLRGSTQEELEADADKLLSLVKTETPPPDFDGGTRETVKSDDMNSLIRRAAGRA